MIDTKPIETRYSALAESSCCLSCGGAIDYAKPQPGEICLDLGSGRGTDVLRMAEAVGKTGFAYGQDVAPGMLQKARETAQRLGVTHVKFLESPLERIPLPHHHVNLVISNCTLNHAGDKMAVWSEIHRVMVDGGRFVVSDIYATGPVAPEYANDPAAVAECWAGAVTRQAYLETLAACGFQNVRILEESAPYEKGKIKVCSFTIQGEKPKKACCCKG
ncbi:MAG: methyltransferase domain-containing protein [Spirochaetes bacterium]|nr:methyltransferase domain-containing protein [Spirochaetota bacterium]